MYIYEQFDKLYKEFAEKYGLPLDDVTSINSVEKICTDAYTELEEMLDDEEMASFQKFRISFLLLCELRITQAASALTYIKCTQPRNKKSHKQ